jgi:hypothetical protein
MSRFQIQQDRIDKLTSPCVAKKGHPALLSPFRLLPCYVCLSRRSRFCSSFEVLTSPTHPHSLVWGRLADFAKPCIYQDATFRSGTQRALTNNVPGSTTCVSPTGSSEMGILSFAHIRTTTIDCNMGRHPEPCNRQEFRKRPLMQNGRGTDRKEGGFECFKYEMSLPSSLPDPSPSESICSISIPSRSRTIFPQG